MKALPTTHCQICERAIFANTGTIAHHGYTRPGHGWQTRSCFGAKYRPYEVACDAIPDAIKAIEAWRANLQSGLANMIAQPPATFTINLGAWGNTTKTVERPADFDVTKRPASWMPRSYESQYWPTRTKMEQQIKWAGEDIARLQKRLADWRAPQ